MGLQPLSLAVMSGQEGWPSCSQHGRLADFLGPLREKHELCIRTVLGLFISNDLFFKIPQCKLLPAGLTTTILSDILHSVSGPESPENKIYACFLLYWSPCLPSPGCSGKDGKFQLPEWVSSDNWAEPSAGHNSHSSSVPAVL